MVWDDKHSHSSMSGLCAVWDPRAVQAISVVFLICGSGVKYGMGK